MRVASSRHFSMELHRREPFKIATGTSASNANFFLELKADDISGLGGCCANSVTKETRDSIGAALDKAHKALSGYRVPDPWNWHAGLEKAVPGAPAARAAVDFALWELVAKRDELPVHEFLGARSRKVLTSVTIGIADTGHAVELAREHIARGFRCLKLKVGEDPKADVERVKAIRDAVGSRVAIRLDCNQGYKPRQAVEFLEAVEECEVEFVEQPVDAARIDWLKEVKRASPVPVMADEALLDMKAAEKLAERQAADLANVKLLKVGGLTPALEMDRVLGSAGIQTMVGCFGESRLSLAAGLHFAVASENCQYADLDSWTSFVDDPVEGGFGFEGGCLSPVDKAGWGAEVDFP